MTVHLCLDVLSAPGPGHPTTQHSGTAQMPSADVSLRATTMVVPQTITSLAATVKPSETTTALLSQDALNAPGLGPSMTLPSGTAQMLSADVLLKVTTTTMMAQATITPTEEIAKP